MRFAQIVWISSIPFSCNPQNVIEIEGDRNTAHKTGVYDRLCKTCYQIEYKEKFRINCKMYDNLQHKLL